MAACSVVVLQRENSPAGSSLWTHVTDLCSSLGRVEKSCCDLLNDEVHQNAEGQTEWRVGKLAVSFGKSSNQYGDVSSSAKAALARMWRKGTARACSVGGDGNR